MGSGWGTRIHPWLIHVNVWQKPPQYCKVISLQLNKFKKHKNKGKKKESAFNAGDPYSIPGSRGFPGEEDGSPLQYSCLESSLDRGAWWAPGGSLGSQRVGCG